MSSAVARPIRSASNTLTSSNFPSFYCRASRAERARSDFFDRGRLEAAREVDAEFLGGAVDVVGRVPHLDRGSVGREDLDVQAQRLQFLQQHLERLGDARLRD